MNPDLDISTEQLLVTLRHRVSDPDYKLNPDDVIATLWPLDGPYGHTGSTSATDAISELVRYLNHGTLNSNAAMPYISTASSMILHLANAAAGLDQLLNQLSARLGSDQHRRSVYHSSDRTDEARATAALAELAAGLRDAAPLAGQLGSKLSELKHSSLGNREDEDGHLIDRQGNRI